MQLESRAGKHAAGVKGGKTCSRSQGRENMQPVRLVFTSAYKHKHKHKQVRTQEHKHKNIRRRSINKIPRYQLSSTTIKMADEDACAYFTRARTTT